MNEPDPIEIDLSDYSTEEYSYVSVDNISLTEGTETITELSINPESLIIVDSSKKEYDNEGQMIRVQLRRMEDQAKQLLTMIKDEDQFPGWMQSKMTLASEYLDTAYDYYKYSDMSEIAEKEVCPNCGNESCTCEEEIEIENNTFYVTLEPDS